MFVPSKAKSRTLFCISFLKGKVGLAKLIRDVVLLHFDPGWIVALSANDRHLQRENEDNIIYIYIFDM